MLCPLHSAQLLHRILHRTDLIIFLLPSRQSSLLRQCLFKGRECWFGDRKVEKLLQLSTDILLHWTRSHNIRSRSTGDFTIELLTLTRYHLWKSVKAYVSSYHHQLIHCIMHCECLHNCTLEIVFLTNQTTNQTTN